MGLDLILLPMTFLGPEHVFAHTALHCIRRTDLFTALRELRSHPVPAEFSTYFCRDDASDEWHYGNTQTDPYGDPLRWVFVEDLLRFADHPDVTDNPDNRAAWAYLAQLPPDDRIALYWD